ncbi:MAG: sodium/proton-translocating pyrophosphatase [Chloroflexi bacterium]|nr:sodium/proton-translocating pyrophosphatase [Chloroflexota bacterium]
MVNVTRNLARPCSDVLVQAGLTDGDVASPQRHDLAGIQQHFHSTFQRWAVAAPQGPRAHHHRLAAQGFHGVAAPHHGTLDVHFLHAHRRVQGGTIIFDLRAPTVLMGVLIGALLPFLFSALSMGAVGRAAVSLVNEVRRQFREIPGIMEGTGRPDYARVVDLSTQGALREMILPGVMAIVTPIIVGFILGPAALGGLLVGSIAAGSLLAITMANSGGAWDNAKKYIEAGHLGGKGSDAHKAAVIGDTVGDPFKDTSGPSLNILIKLMAIVSLVFAPLFI